MDHYIVGVILGLALGVLFGIILSSATLIAGDIWLTSETADDICQQLLGNETLNVEAHTEDGKLICEVPSFDNTQNIIFKGNGGEDGINIKQ